MTYTVPQDDNGVMTDGLLQSGGNLHWHRGRYPQTDSGGAISLVSETFPVGVTGAQSPTGPTTISPLTATPLTFATSYHRLMLQNNSAVTLYFSFDAAATAGGFQLAPGSLFEFDTGSTISLYQTSGSAIPVNGINGLSVQAW